MLLARFDEQMLIQLIAELSAGLDCKQYTSQFTR